MNLKITLNCEEKIIEGYYHYCYFIENNNGRIGYAECNLGNNGEDFVLDIIHINREHRGKGYGSILFRFILSHLEELGLSIKLTGEVIPQEGISKKDLIEFYEKLGCKIINKDMDFEKVVNLK